MMPDSSDQCNPSHECPPQQTSYDPNAYYPLPPQRYGFQPYQPSYARGQGGYPPAMYSLPGYTFPSHSDPTRGDHMWGDYHGGVDSMSKHRTEGNGVDSESDANVRSDDKKGGQFRWNSTTDNILLDFLCEAAREGRKSGKKWDASVWNDLIAVLSEKSTDKVKYNNIENRLRQMRTEYVNFKELKSKSGVSYDPIKQTILAPEGFWLDILTNSNNQKRFKAFRERGLKWNFEKLSIVLGDSHATGSYALGGLDKIESTNIDKGTDDLPSLDGCIDLDDETTSSASTRKAPLKRQHGKRNRVVDEVKGMLQGVNDHLEKLREIVDPLSFGKTLRQAVMGVQGYNQKNKSMAFKILMKNRSDAEIFVLTDEEGRKDMFDEMGIQVEDV